MAAALAISGGKKRAWGQGQDAKNAEVLAFLLSVSRVRVGRAVSLN